MNVSPVRLAGPHEWLGCLQLVPAPQEDDFGIFDAATESPSRRSGGGLQNAKITFRRGWTVFTNWRHHSHSRGPPRLVQGPRRAHTGRLRHVWFWIGGDRQRPSSRKVGVARAGRLYGTWANALSRGTWPPVRTDLPGKPNYGVTYLKGCFRPSLISAYDTWF